MPVTLEDVQKILEGGPILIDFPYPLEDRPAPALWYMKQPDDWLYDMAQAVREAAVAELEQLPEMEAMKNLGPSPEWVAQQTASRLKAETRIKELEDKKDAIQPEETLELENQRDYIARLMDPALTSRFDEIAGKRGRKAFEGWLMPRLIVDEAGKPLFPMDKPEGQQRWLRLGRDTKQQLNGYFWQVLLLVQTAKNFKPDQSSS